MELAQLIQDLSHPAAYPAAVDTIEVHQTHISVVFLTGAHAYKIKKPVDLGFLEFGTLAQRRHFCEEEVRLNRRLAPSVYLGVVPVTQDAGRIAVNGSGEVVEWAVKMQRLPASATLEQRLLRGALDESTLRALAGKVAAFHAAADTNEHIASFGRFEVVARNARENFTQAERQVGTTVSRAVFERLRERTEAVLRDKGTLIERRARPGITRDTHGDLHLDHVYLFADRPPPEDLVIIDCIEFNERFRYADPVADMAFLTMDLAFHGRRDLATVFADAYFDASGDAEGRELLAFYTAYRAVVRAKVEGFKLVEKEVPADERRAERARARGHWLLALGELEQPLRRPCLILIGGLPGTGKSTLARALAERAGLEVLRSDVIRKELAGLVPTDAARVALEQDIYSPDWSERTYAEVLRRAEALLFEGKRVIVDANFREDRRRCAFVAAARDWGVSVLFLECRAGDEVVRERLRTRRGDASDANWRIYQQAAEGWEPPAADVIRVHRVVTTERPPQEVEIAALRVLRAEDLA